MISNQGRKSALVHSRKVSRSVSMIGPERIMSAMLDMPPACPRLSLLGKAQTTEALVEARDLAACVEHPVAAAGPGRVDAGVDVEVQRVAFLAPGRAGLELGAVGHLDVDHVVVGVGFGLHASI